MQGKTPVLVFGAVLGVLVTLGALFAFAQVTDEHFVTRREYAAQLVEINRSLDRIESRVGHVEGRVEQIYLRGQGGR